MTELGEDITVTKPNNKSKSSVVRLSRGTYLGGGYEGQVYKAKTEVAKGQKKRSIDLAYKSLYPPTPYHKYIYEDLFKTYNLAKEAGLPVPPTFRSAENEKGILMTDLTDGGKNIVISHNDDEPETIETLYSNRAEQMKNFNRSLPLNSEKNDIKLSEYAEKAAHAGLILSPGALFTVIKPNGEYDFILTDFGGDVSVDNFFQESVRRDMNKGYLNEFKNMMSKIQNYEHIKIEEGLIDQKVVGGLK